MSQSTCFKVFYTKNVYQKKKSYSEGVLVCKGRNAKLFDSEGLCLLNFKNSQKPIIDQEYRINNSYLVLIDQPASINDFESGKIFMNEPIQLKPKQKKKVSKKEKDDVMLECGLYMEKNLFEVLRAHQKQGVSFMYQCLTKKKKQNLSGCILADFMGLGKTLQTLALSYSLLRQSLINKFIIVCPLTLLSVWEKQTKKWLQNKLNPLICYGNMNEVTATVKTFTSTEYRMLVISYESFYRSIDKLSGKTDMIVFDEGHRLKNKKSKLLIKMKVFKCEKRVILTGTPIQNNMDELFTCLSIVYPQIFTSSTIFKNVFQKPILEGMAKTASEEQKKIARQRTFQLSSQIKQFSLRRTADVLEQYLPKKRQYLIFFRLTELQKLWYKRILEIKTEEQTLKALNQLRKLFTHPTILKSDKIEKCEWEDCPEECVNEKSYKVEFVIDLVENCHKNKQKIVIVSYYTETLDFIANILKEKFYSFTKLDGRTKGSDRKKIIQQFQYDKQVLLLSGKAGGTGLTLTCASTMVMIQPDWNPSNDSQVMGRVWRQGQTKQVAIYRLIVASSFEEKMLQRQNLKKTLADRLIDDGEGKENYDFRTLGKLFIENEEKVITFAEEENKMEEFVKKNEVSSPEGIIFIKIKESHQEKESFVNEFQNLNFQPEEDQSDETQQETDEENSWSKSIQKIKVKKKQEKKPKKSNGVEESEVTHVEKANLYDDESERVLVKEGKGKVDEYSIDIPLALRKIKKLKEK